MNEPRLNLIMVSGDASVAAGRQTGFFRLLERFAPAWARVDVITPRPRRVTTTTLFDNVFLHPSPRSRAMLWRHIVTCGAALHGERAYHLMASHDHGWHQNGIGTWLLHRRTGTPYVSEFHGFTGHPRSATVKAWAQGRASRGYVRLASRHARAFRVVNAGDLPGLLTSLGVPAHRILVLHALYLDHQVFRPRPAPKTFDVLYCGRAEPNKGGSLLLDALAHVRRRRPETTALLVAAGPAQPAWRRRADRLGLGSSITWRDWVDSPEALADVYRSSRVLVCPSLSEGGPRVTVEAMACGIPVITTPVGLMRELIDHGRHGLLVDWQPATIAAAIEQVLADPEQAESMAAAGHEQVARFDRDVVIDAYAAAYVALAAGLPGASARG